MTALILAVTTLVVPGLIGKLKAKFNGRKGAPILQPWFDIIRLARKGNVMNENAVVTPWAITGYTVCTLGAALLLPVASFSSMISFEYDFILFAYLLGTGRFLLLIAGLDAGSAFQGMGVNRDILLALLIEPAFFIVLAGLALLTGQTSFSAIFKEIHYNHYYGLAFGIIGSYIFMKIALVENSRVPVDDPKTHLELTMLHEVIVLDISGFDLALIHLSSALKLAIFGSLITELFTTSNHPIWENLLIFTALIVAYSIAIAFIETFRGRNPMQKNTHFAGTILGLSLILFVLALVLTNKFLGGQ